MPEPTPSEALIGKLLVIINERCGYTMRELKEHCRRFIDQTILEDVTPLA
jgi:hypothetical protein